MTNVYVCARTTASQILLHEVDALETLMNSHIMLHRRDRDNLPL